MAHTLAHDHRGLDALALDFASFRALTQLLVGLGSGPDRELAGRAQAAFHRMVTNVVPDLRRAVRAGRYRAGDLELDAYMLWGALMGAGEFRAFVRADSTDALADAYLRLFTLGTRPRGRTRRHAALRGQVGLAAFISTSPARISTAATIRVAESASPSASTPTANVPTAPRPVHTV